MSETYDKISEILSDPESIKLISEIAQGFMKNADESEDNDSTGSTEIVNALTAATGESSTGNEANRISRLLEDIVGSGNIDSSISLISAIRPYMSSHRRENADTVIKMLKTLKVVSKSNISDIGKLLNLV